MIGSPEEIRKMVERVEFDRVRGNSSIYLVTSPVGFEGVSRIASTFVDELMKAHNLGVFLIEAPETTEGEAVSDVQQTAFFEELRSQYDMVVVDGGGLLERSGSLSFLQNCDAAIMVLAAEKTTRDQAHRTMALLKQFDLRLMGAVLNGTTDPVPRRFKRKVRPCL